MAFAKLTLGIAGEQSRSIRDYGRGCHSLLSPPKGGARLVPAARPRALPLVRLARMAGRPPIRSGCRLTFTIRQLSFELQPEQHRTKTQFFQAPKTLKFLYFFGHKIVLRTTDWMQQLGFSGNKPRHAHMHDLPRLRHMGHQIA